MLRLLRTAIKLALLAIVAVVLFVAGINAWVMTDAGPFLYDSPDTVPFNAVGMVLGTSHRTRSGNANQHFATRMDAAAELYRAVFISRHYDLDAIGYAAVDVPFSYGLRSRSREMLARVKAVLDIYLLDTKPGSEH